MEMNLLIVVYFLIVMLTVLALVIVKDKQVLQNLFEKQEIQQEEITELKLEKVRLKHVIRMQDETISHMLAEDTDTPKKVAAFRSKEIPVVETADQEWHLDEYESMNQEYYQI